MKPAEHRKVARHHAQRAFDLFVSAREEKDFDRHAYLCELAHAHQQQAWAHDDMAREAEESS